MKKTKSGIDADLGRQTACRNKVVKMIGIGKTRQECLEYIVDEFAYAESMAIEIYQSALRRVKEKYDKFAEDSAKMNIDRLNTLIDDCYESNDRRNMLTAIDTLNKMCGNYIDRKEIKTSNEPITISFS